MEDSSIFNQYQTNSPFDCLVDGLSFQSFPSHEGYYPTKNSVHEPDSTSGSYSEASDQYQYHHHAVEHGLERPAKQLKTNSWNSSCTTELVYITPSPKASPSSSQIISFENSMTSSPAPTVAGSSFHGNINSSSSLISQGSYLDQFCSKKKVQEPRRVSSVIRDPSHAKDHVIAERKRREKLNQRFIALSALVPGLKKVCFPLILFFFPGSTSIYMWLQFVGNNFLQIRAIWINSVIGKINWVVVSVIN